MKLTYRGVSYEMPTPIRFSAAPNQPAIKLQYRGNSYDYTPPVMPAVVDLEGQVVTLIYRGQTYKRKFLSPQSVLKLCKTD